ncbi:MAG: hypothetical protein GX219_01920 [Tissierellia bacterium]|nr:hypothetical protein [Tissierellia bacterium]
MKKKRKKSPINVSMILSLLMAVLLWLFVMTGKNPETSISYYNIEVELLNEDSLANKDLVISDKKDWTVNIDLKGHKNDFLYFKKENIRASVDLSGYQEGELKVPVKVELINSNSNLKVQDVEPREIVFNFDKIVSQEKPFNLNILGALDDGLSIGNIEKETKEIEVRGPRTIVNQVAEGIASVDVTGRTDDTLLKVQVELVDAKGKKVEGLKYSPETIDVKIPINMVKTLPIELITTGELPEEYVRMNAETDPLTIDVIGKKEDLTNLVKVSTKSVNINDIINNPDMKVELDLPVGVNLYDKDTSVSVKLVLEKLVESEFTFNKEDIKILNLGQNLSAEILEDEEIHVSMMVEETIAEDLNKEDISLSLNLAGLAAGEHELEIGLKNTLLIQNFKITPSILTVKIIEEVANEDL